MVTAAKTTSAIGVHMIVAFATMYVLTGSVAFGGIAALVEPVCNVIVMPLHEKLWRRIRAKLAKRKREAGQIQAQCQARHQHDAVAQQMQIA